MLHAALWLIAVVMAAVFSALLFVWLGGERGRVRSSTREFLRQSGVGLNALHGYVYLRWIRAYIRTLLRLPDPRRSQPAARAAAWFAQHYQAPVSSLAVNQRPRACRKTA